MCKMAKVHSLGGREKRRWSVMTECALKLSVHGAALSQALGARECRSDQHSLASHPFEMHITLDSGTENAGVFLAASLFCK